MLASQDLKQINVCFSILKAVYDVRPTSSLAHIINASDVLTEYNNWYRVEGQQLNITGVNITECSLEEEMKKVKASFVFF